MANYTIELKDVVLNHNIFDFHYPFFDEKKRQEFEQSFIRHFYFREICCPTVDRFKVYLEDKMNVVFPYYNELMNAALIEYSVLDNYNITETFERKYENKGKSRGVSSTVGQVMDDQTSETNDKRDSENHIITDTTGTDTKKETYTENQTTTEDTNGKTEREINGNDSSSKSGNTSTTAGDEEKRRFLDTPQGKLDLLQMDYLTTLHQDSKQTNSQTVNSESGSGEHSETDVTDTTGQRDVVQDTEGEKNITGNTTGNQTTNGEDSTTGNSKTVFAGNQKSTNDNDSRTEHMNEHVESYEMKKRGNIGVDTDADMIQKHINLQKVLKQIERMFFDECEDLFMLVY